MIIVILVQKKLKHSVIIEIIAIIDAAKSNEKKEKMK